MAYEVFVEKFGSAYRNAGIYMMKTFGLTSMDDILKKIEEECNVRSVSGWEHDHYFEFQSEKDFIMFVLRWS